MSKSHRTTPRRILNRFGGILRHGAGGDTTRRRLEPVHCTVVAMDVAGSGGRDDVLQLRMRAELLSILADTLARQSLDIGALHLTDLGDGIRLIAPPGISPLAFLDPFVPNLAAALRRYRSVASQAARLRLRVAVHMGLLQRDAVGWAGRPLVTCARMLDAVPVRQVLAADDGVDLVLVVSQAVYADVVEHGYGPDPACFQPADIAEKETRAQVWIHVPGHRAPPGLTDERAYAQCTTVSAMAGRRIVGGRH